MFIVSAIGRLISLAIFFFIWIPIAGSCVSAISGIASSKHIDFGYLMPVFGGSILGVIIFLVFMKSDRIADACSRMGRRILGDNAVGGFLGWVLMAFFSACFCGLIGVWAALACGGNAGSAFICMTILGMINAGWLVVFGFVSPSR